MPDDFRVSITNAPGKGAYPISGFTYLLVYEKQNDAAKGQALVELPLVGEPRRARSRGALPLAYAPLPRAWSSASRPSCTSSPMRW